MKARRSVGVPFDNYRGQLDRCGTTGINRCYCRAAATWLKLLQCSNGAFKLLSLKYPAVDNKHYG